MTFVVELSNISSRLLNDSEMVKISISSTADFLGEYRGNVIRVSGDVEGRTEFRFWKTFLLQVYLRFFVYMFWF